MIKEYRTIRQLSGTLLTVDRVTGVTCGELGELLLPDGGIRRCRIQEITGETAVVELLESSTGIHPSRCKIRFLGDPLRLAVSEDMLGRVFNGLGDPIDGAPAILPEAYRDIGAISINPIARDYPARPIRTGLSAVDGLTPLCLGQTLTICSSPGLPHGQLVSQIFRQATLADGDGERFAVVFAAVGVSFDEADFFLQELRRAGAAARTVSFLSPAGDPAGARATAFQMALTAAEYLAFERDMQVLVLLTDLAGYAEALGETNSVAGELPIRISSGFASLCERAGCRADRRGSITLLSLLTLPEDDRSSPVRELAGCAADGRLVLSQELHRAGIDPPVDALASRSHVTGWKSPLDGTQADRAAAVSQLLEAYATGWERRNLMHTLGEGALTQTELPFVHFADAFERRYIAQNSNEPRSSEQTERLGWELLSLLPRHELKRLTPEQLKRIPDGSQESALHSK
ncbi:MAG: V-type synthase subunit [Oscillospiraceae bacterium]|nr:V-type synthase subunit [Oscillospiraceae bacterium]